MSRIRQSDRMETLFWVEVTLPGLGAPRPIQLGLERDGQIEPLALR